MKQIQKDQEEAKLKAIQDEEQRFQLEEQLAKQQEEKLRAEKEQRERKKQKEKDRIRRKKEEGTYQTKEQREKLERARVQLEAAGIQVPARSAAQKTATGNEEASAQAGKKRVVYEDRRKKPKGNGKRNDSTPMTWLFKQMRCFSDDEHGDSASSTAATTLVDAEGKPTSKVRVDLSFSLFRIERVV